MSVPVPAKAEEAHNTLPATRVNSFMGDTSWLAPLAAGLSEARRNTVRVPKLLRSSLCEFCDNSMNAARGRDATP
jgi:hypothetical protein